MIDIKEIIKLSPYSLNRHDKKKMFVKLMKGLTEYHLLKCPEYANIVKLLRAKDIIEIEDTPFIPARLYKSMEMKSILPTDIFKVLTSSGTSGSNPSKIFLDKDTANNQIRVLVNIVSSFIPKRRIPILIIDSSSVFTNRSLYSARGAAIAGFSMMGEKTYFAFDKDMKLDIKNILEFLEKYGRETFLIFGFTSVVWIDFIQSIKDMNLNLSKGVLIHGGGWKKMSDISIPNAVFKEQVEKICLINKIHNYYGMVEQTGSIFMECEFGHLHSSIFSDIIIRDFKDFSKCDNNEKGLIQVLSILPHSYPGHSILTEDLGVIHGEDDCLCGRMGKYFSIYGRIENSEIRGCSDVLRA